MNQIEGKQQKFEVKIDDNGDFKIVSGNNEAPTKKRKQQNKMMSTEPKKRSVATHVVRRRKRTKSFIPSGLSKETVQKIRRNVSIQRIAEYVRIVSPDDGTVDEAAFLSWIKWQLMKKHPDKYLEKVKEKGIMVPCGEGKLKFTRRW